MVSASLTAVGLRVGLRVFLPAALRREDGKLIGSLQNFRSVFTFLAFSFMAMLLGVLGARSSAGGLLRGVRMGSRPHPVHRSPIRLIRGSEVIRVAPVLWIRVIMALRLASVFPFVELIIDIPRENGISGRLNVF
jgi:hypothetical protein